MSDDDITYIANRTHAAGEAAPFGILRRDRRQHLVCLGKTGTGKSTLLEGLILQDIARGEGVALLDPHGDLAERLLDYVPPWRTDDLCYLDPADLAHPVGLNILAGHPPERRHLAVAAVVSSFKAVWADSWGPRLEYLLANAVAALTELRGATLLHLPRLLTDDAFRVRACERLADPVVRRFWAEEFAAFDRRLRAEITAPVLNKVGQLLLSPLVRNVFGQERSAFDPRLAMDGRRILIANLAKGRIGGNVSNLVGSLLIAGFELAAASRADTPEEGRADFHLYADEFQNFATDSFAAILSEARKHRLCLSLFHQFGDQLSETVRRAVFGNVGTIVAFRVGQRDAEHLAAEFEHELRPGELTGLEPFEVAVRLLHNGRQRTAFKARTGLPEAYRHGRRENLVAQSRMRFGRPRERVEKAIARALG